MAWPIFTNIASALRSFFRCQRTSDIEDDQEDHTPAPSSTCHKAMLTVSASGKVMALGGSAVFVAFHLSNYVYHNEEGHNEPLGISLANVFLVGATITGIISRYFNFMRSDTEVEITKELFESQIAKQLGFKVNILNKHIASEDKSTLLTESKLPLIEKSISQLITEYGYEKYDYERPATFWDPGRSAWDKAKSAEIPKEATYRQKLGYRALSMTAAMYSGFSAVSGKQAQLSLVVLFQILFNHLIKQISHTDLDPYNEECGKTLSPIYTIALTNLLTLLLSAANFISFNKSNRRWMRKNYREYIIDGKYKEISCGTVLFSIVVSTFTTIASFYSSVRLFEMLGKNVICHLGLELPTAVSFLPGQIETALAYAGAGSGFIVNGVFLGIPSTHGSSAKAETRKTITNNLDVLPPKWKKLHYSVILPANVVDAAREGISTFIGAATLGETIAHNKDLNYDAWMIAFGIVTGGCASLNQFFYNQYSCAREYETRARDVIKSSESKRTKPSELRSVVYGDSTDPSEVKPGSTDEKVKLQAKLLTGDSDHREATKPLISAASQSEGASVTPTTHASLARRFKATDESSPPSGREITRPLLSSASASSSSSTSSRAPSSPYGSFEASTNSTPAFFEAYKPSIASPLGSPVAYAALPAQSLAAPAESQALIVGF